MARNIVLMALLVAPMSCSTVAVRQAEWCTSPGPFVREFRQRPEIRVQQVAAQRVRAAYDALAKRPLIAIDRPTFIRMAGEGAERPEQRYLYLARAGIMAPPAFKAAELHQEASSASFDVYEGLSPSDIQIVSLITSEVPQRARNIPVLIASPTEVKTAAARCLGGR